jgi:hypothetical protein
MLIYLMYHSFAEDSFIQTDQEPSYVLSQMPEFALDRCKASAFCQWISLWTKEFLPFCMLQGCDALLKLPVQEYIKRSQM